MNHSTFTIAYWCVLIAALLPIVCAGLAKREGFGKPRHLGGYDNANPRAWLAKQSEWSARANAAQANSFEGLPLFIGAVIIAHQMGAVQVRVDILAFLYIVLRMVYIALYVANLHGARSVVWGLGLAVNLGILFAGYR